MYENPEGRGTASICPSLPTPMCGDRPAISLVVSLGKTLNGIASTFEWLNW